MKTRRFKALNGVNGNTPKIVDKIATYDENGVMIDCQVIRCSPNEFDGKEHYYPKNKNHKFGLFTDRPKDALDCIKADLGDAFAVKKFFGLDMHNVIRFIDREYGENLRKQTLDGWKDAKFAYALRFSFLSSFSSGSKICKNDTLSSFDTKPEDILTFETENDANNFVIKLESEANEYFNEYKKLKTTGDADYDYENIYKPFFAKVKGADLGLSSIYYTLFLALVESEETSKKTYKIETIQYTI